jgi:RNA-directed DNA polymerase
MSLQTPDKIRILQRKLYLKAKAEPDYRFYLLYDKIHREDILRHAYDLMRANDGAPGVDGVTFAMIEAEGREEWLSGIRKELQEKTYQPAPVRRVMIPKPGGKGERPLGIPTIRDRTVQAAAKLVLEPIFEADLDPSAYGYRPRRSGLDAVKEVHALICRGYTDVYPAHTIIRNFFGSMTRKLSVTSSQYVGQFLGTSLRRKFSIAMLNSLNVA